MPKETNTYPRIIVTAVKIKNPYPDKMKKDWTGWSYLPKTSKLLETGTHLRLLGRACAAYLPKTSVWAEIILEKCYPRNELDEEWALEEFLALGGVDGNKDAWDFLKALWSIGAFTPTVITSLTDGDWRSLVNDVRKDELREEKLN